MYESGMSIYLYKSNHSEHSFILIRHYFQFSDHAFSMLEKERPQ